MKGKKTILSTIIVGIIITLGYFLINKTNHSDQKLEQEIEKTTERFKTDQRRYTMVLVRMLVTPWCDKCDSVEENRRVKASVAIILSNKLVAPGVLKQPSTNIAMIIMENCSRLCPKEEEWSQAMKKDWIYLSSKNQQLEELEKNIDVLEILYPDENKASQSKDMGPTT